MNCLHSFRADNALTELKRFCENNNCCCVEMPTKLNKILKYNHGEKSLKTPFVIYFDLECLLLKQQSFQINPNKSYTERNAVHEPSGYFLDLVYSFDSKEEKRSFYRGNNYIKKFCSELKELGTKVVYEQKEMTPFTTDDVFLYESQKVFIYAKEGFVMIKRIKRDLNYTKK